MTATPTSPTAPASSDPGAALGVAAALAAVLAWATPTVIAKGLAMPALSIVFFRGWIGAAWAVGFLYLRGGRLTVAGLKASAWGGVALGVDLMCFFTAIKLTTVANATMIGALSPLVMVFAAPLLFGERIRTKDLAAAVVAMAGLAMVSLGSVAMPAWNPLGDLFAVVTLFAWSGYLIVSKSVQASVQPAEFTAWVTLVATTLATPFALLWGDGLTPPATPLVLAALAFMALSGWLGHLLMNWSLRRIPVWVGSVCSLTVPVLATGLAAVFLGERVVGVQGVGMFLVLAALVVVGRPQALRAEPAKVES